MHFNKEKLMFSIAFLAIAVILMFIYFLYPFSDLQRHSEARHEIGMMLLQFSAVKKGVERNLNTNEKRLSLLDDITLPGPFNAYAYGNKVMILGEHAVVVLSLEAEPIMQWKYTTFLINKKDVEFPIRR